MASEKMGASYFVSDGALPDGSTFMGLVRRDPDSKMEPQGVYDGVRKVLTTSTKLKRAKTAEGIQGQFIL